MSVAPAELFFWGRRWRIYTLATARALSCDRYKEHQIAARRNAPQRRSEIVSHTARSGAMKTFAETTKSTFDFSRLVLCQVDDTKTARRPRPPRRRHPAGRAVKPLGPLDEFL